MEVIQIAILKEKSNVDRILACISAFIIRNLYSLYFMFSQYYIFDILVIHILFLV